MRAGTSQYTVFATGSLIASIPATILPSASEVTITPTTAAGVPVYRLRWKSFVGDASTPVTETLDLAASGDHAPVSETSVTAGGTQTDTFSQWNTPPAASRHDRLRHRDRRLGPDWPVT
jgi:hypothetical protein